MRDLLVSGTRVMTTDEIADALLTYAVELTAHRVTAVARFPAIVDGQHVETHMILGSGIPLTAVSVDPVLPVDLDGADFAVSQIHTRTRALSTRMTER